MSVLLFMTIIASENELQGLESKLIKNTDTNFGWAQNYRITFKRLCIRTATTMSSSDGDTPGKNMGGVSFEREDHVKYFLSCLKGLRSAYTSLDTTRLTVAYFSVIGLDMLDSLDQVDSKRVCNYIYGLQIAVNAEGGNALCRECTRPHVSGNGGFLGSSCAGQEFRTYYNHGNATGNGSGNGKMDSANVLNFSQQGDAACSSSNGGERPGDCGCVSFEYMQGHLAMAYTSLATLITLKDDLSRLDRPALLQSLQSAQLASGAFRATRTGNEADMRFVFCACAISYMLGDWSGVDRDRVVEYVKSCITYEGGVSLTPGTEAQGGATFCAVSSLVMMDKLEDISVKARRALVGWCEQRVQAAGGYNGRTNKVPDSCYSFWIGATLDMLGCFHNTDTLPALEFLLNECQYSHYMDRAGIGGFSKTPGDYPDILHTFYSIAWLSINRSVSTLRPIFPTLAICQDKADSIRS